MAAPASTVPVVSVHHYTDRLFKFRVKRPKNFRFESGQFAMIGLNIEDEPIMRAYSMASPSWDDELEFYSIIVPDGPLTSQLRYIKPEDPLLISGRGVGSLTMKALKPGKRLFMLATGTGIAPFASIMRDPDTYERFDEVYLTHTCREAAELSYGKELVAALREDPLCGEFANKLTYYSSVTREEYEHMGRITDLLESGQVFSDLGIAPFDAEGDRVMICGSMELNRDLQKILEAQGFVEGSRRQKGSYVLERAFVG
ncbi:MAG: ferredoxin--NADP reductase [Myxococcota bacterium]|nr:ferredoxin--NADP reductase [Myxococcota bacterium]